MKFNRPRNKPNLLRRYRGLDWVLLLAFFAVMFWLASDLFFPKENFEKPMIEGRVHVVDGDSLNLGTRRLRLIGIDAAEYRQICHKNGKAYFCGEQATKYLKELLKHSKNYVKCKSRGLDRYQRDLVICFPKQKTLENSSLNAEMVRSGWAVSYGDYKSEERFAKTKKLGLWAGKFEKPAAWRKKSKLKNGKNSTN